MGKVISTRDVVFDEESIFSGNTEDLMDNLKHSTLEEIATFVRSVELPPTNMQQGEPEIDSFYEDESISTSTSWEDHQPRDDGRKKGYEYLPTPPQTPPPVALLAQSIAGACPLKQGNTFLLLNEEKECSIVQKGDTLSEQGTAQTRP